MERISEYEVNAIEKLSGDFSKELKLRFHCFSSSFYQKSIELIELDQDHWYIDDEEILNEYKELINEVRGNMYGKLISNNPPFSICLN